MLHRHSINTAFHLMQLCDSALPVGGFSFSCALESAVAQGVVLSVEELEEFVQAVVRQTLFTDGVAALHALRYGTKSTELLRADSELYVRKPSLEWRTMSCRMGRKLAELSAAVLPCHETESWLAAIVRGEAFGSYAISQALIFMLCGAAEEELFAAVGYGAASMVTNAALRMMRVTHHDTQRLLFSLAPSIEQSYDEASVLSLEQMRSFSPQLEILASMHERGTQRMFMS